MLLNSTSLSNELDYLVDAYYNKEDWHGDKLDYEDIVKHFEKQLAEKNCVFLKSSNKEEIRGYLEIWWLDKEQLSTIINGQWFDVRNENLTDGDFVMVASAYLEPQYRGQRNIDVLNQMMKDRHKDRDYVGIIYENKGQFSFYKKGEI